MLTQHPVIGSLFTSLFLSLFLSFFLSFSLSNFRFTDSQFHLSYFLPLNSVELSKFSGTPLPIDTATTVLDHGDLHYWSEIQRRIDHINLPDSVSVGRC